MQNIFLTSNILILFWKVTNWRILMWGGLISLITRRGRLPTLQMYRDHDDAKIKDITRFTSLIGKSEIKILWRSQMCLNYTKTLTSHFLFPPKTIDNSLEPIFYPSILSDKATNSLAYREIVTELVSPPAEQDRWTTGAQMEWTTRRVIELITFLSSTLCQTLNWEPWFVSWKVCKFNEALLCTWRSLEVWVSLYVVKN